MVTLWILGEAVMLREDRRESEKVKRAESGECGLMICDLGSLTAFPTTESLST